MNKNQQIPALQKAVLYARVSSKEQEKEGFSVATDFSPACKDKEKTRAMAKLINLNFIRVFTP